MAPFILFVSPASALHPPLSALRSLLPLSLPLSLSLSLELSKD